ncbi:hypothetical protein, partial [Stenotrophomonas sp. HMWF003]|uniref:hypothetical protein n=1 Tax=Stenotrophomonas sp. HMWF003 TaxID=2056840 RepID=UPI001C631537
GRRAFKAHRDTSCDIGTLGVVLQRDAPIRRMLMGMGGRSSTIPRHAREWGGRRGGHGRSGGRR